jgi:hypothetical protein
MLINSKILVLLVLLACTSCGTILTGPAMQKIYSELPVLNDQQSRVYFVRPGTKHFGAKTRIHIDEQRVNNLPLSGCYYKELTPGKHFVMIDMWAGIGSHEKELDLKAGESRYFKVWPRSSRLISGMFGVLGAAVENVASDTKNDGEMELIEFTEAEANMYFAQCRLHLE